MKCIERALRPHGVPPTTTPSVVTPIASLFLVVAPSPCCDVVVAVSLSILQDVSIQSQDSRSISDSTPYGSPRNSPKVFLFRMITLFNARRGIPEREKRTSKKGSESARDTSTLVCRSAAQLDRTGPATRPIQ